MPITQAQITELLTGQRKRQDLGRATKQEHRLRMHSLTARSVTLTDATADRNPATRDFLNNVRSRLTAEKYERFRQVYRSPLPTAVLSEEIHEALAKVFDGRNPTETYQFTAESLEEDWRAYRTDDLGGRDAWRSEGVTTLRQRPNGVVVVDLKEQGDGRPRPYWYVADSAAVCHYELLDQVQFDHLILSGPVVERVRTYYVFDDEYYRMVEHAGDTVTVVTEVAHDLGYCPARFFWTDAVDSADPAVKRSPLSAQLAELDEYLWTELSKRINNQFALYHITQAIEVACDYESDNERCEKGVLVSTRGLGAILDGHGHARGCPVCARNRWIGPGTIIEVPEPDEDGGDYSEAIRIVTVPTDNLEFNLKNCTLMRQTIFNSVVGSSMEPLNDQAVNEKQVMSFWESRKAALRQLAANFEAVQTWAEATICRLRYGELFVACEIDMGSDWFILSSQDLLELYEKCRAQGSDAAVLDFLQDQYLQSLHRDNPEQYQRARILTDLLPARHLTRTDLKELFASGGLEARDYALTLNLSALAARFERENGPLVEFASLLPYDEKITRIADALRAYLPAPSIDNPPVPEEGEGDNE